MSDTHLKEGSEVEVFREANGPNTLTYYSATVLRSPTKPRKTNTATPQILIQYQKLMFNGTQMPKTEFVDVGSVRPIPPLIKDQCFQNGDSVDVFCDNGWQKGTVKALLENSMFVVGFDGKSEGIVVNQSSLRHHSDWDPLSNSWNTPLLHHTPAMDKRIRRGNFKRKRSSRNSETLFEIGMGIEVKTDEEGYVGAWFGATVVGAIRNDQILVQYLNLLTDDETEPLKEVVDIKHVRPFPPPVSSNNAFEQHDMVDVWHNEVWWEGEVSQVLPGHKCEVYFKYTNENLVYDHSALRHHQDWIDGKWIQGGSVKLDPNVIVPDIQLSMGEESIKFDANDITPKAQKSLKFDTNDTTPKAQFREGESIDFDSNGIIPKANFRKVEESNKFDADEMIQKAQFTKGTKVELKSDEVGLENAWFAATIINVLKNGEFEVQYDNILTEDESDFLKEQMNASYLRPSPPQIEHNHPYRLFEVVDVWYNDAWWVGRVSQVHNSKYSVQFKNSEKLEFEHSELRPHQDWIDGNWVIARMDWGGNLL